MMVKYCCILCHAISHLGVLKDLNCLELHCAMVIATLFTSAHCSPQSNLFCNNSLFFFFLQTVNPSLYSNLHGLIGDYSVTFVR